MPRFGPAAGTYNPFEVERVAATMEDRMKMIAALLLALATAGATAAETGDVRVVDEAMQAAAREHRPVLLDFSAQWCYSCYFMATHVLTGAQWQAVEGRARVLEVDGDSPEGARWMAKLAIKALPSYVVLRADGSELGRVVGEQSREKFYPAIERILAGSDVLDTLKARAKGGAVDAVAETLASFHARDDIGAGLSWYAALPAAVKTAADKDARAVLWRERLQLDKAARAKDYRGCSEVAQRVLAGDVGCDRYYVVDKLLDCTQKQAPDQRNALLAKQKPALDALLDKQVFVATPACADQRSAVMVAAELDKAIGDSAGEEAVLDRAIKYARAQLHDDYASDRNLADNLRVYLTRAGRSADVDALLPKLVKAYPDDYVYAYRYGRVLLDRGRAAEALTYLEQAAAKTFGANRLAVAELRVKALLALERRADAEKVVAEALEANGPWFPEAAAKLKAMLKS